MEQSKADSDATAFDRLTGTIPLTPATAIHVARAHLRNTGESAAVVFRSDRPVGVVTAAALTNAHTASGTDAPISTVMDHVTVPVRPGSNVDETVRAFTQAAQSWLRQRPAPRPRAERRATPTTSAVPDAPPATARARQRVSARVRVGHGHAALSASTREEVEVPW